MKSNNRIESLIEKWKLENRLRSLRLTESERIDFSSNDYLGYSRSEELKSNIIAAYQKSKAENGSTGSRLITGNSRKTEEVESYLKDFFHSDSALLFNSGYSANLALLSSVPQKGDTIIYDEFAHACIKDGARLSLAKRFSFRHNDLKDLQYKIEKSEGTIYVVCESVYSMDGDLSPLVELEKICSAHNANLIIDEAHSTGIWGAQGQGLTYELGLLDKTFAVINTFGKAMGIHGACIHAHQDTRTFLINHARPFIYTTAPSLFEVISIEESFKLRMNDESNLKSLTSFIDHFNSILPNFATESPIKSVVIPGNERVKCIAEELQKKQLDVRPILSPTVKEGTERLRICLHSFNTTQEIDFLCEQLKELCT